MKYKFVEYIPEKLDEMTLYVSIEFKIAKHMCPCGCKSEIVTTLSPAGWSVIYNGQEVSLRPSIGNWQHPCKSHYYITNNSVVWLSQFSDESIAKVIKNDQNAVSDYHKQNGFFVKISNMLIKIFK